jgi:multidrug resistance efflux pump
LDDRDLQADLVVKRAALDNARAQLAKLEAQPRPEELPPLEAKVTEAKALLADAEVQVKLIEGVSDERAVKKEDVLRRQQNYNAAKARLAQAEKDLALTKAGAWGPDLAIGRAQVEQASAAVHQDEVNIERLTTRADRRNDSSEQSTDRAVCAVWSVGRAARDFWWNGSDAFARGCR